MKIWLESIFRSKIKCLKLTFFRPSDFRTCPWARPRVSWWRWSRSGGMPPGRMNKNLRFQYISTSSLLELSRGCSVEIPLYSLFAFSSFVTLKFPTDLLVCQIQTSKTGGQPYSGTSAYEVSEYSMDWM